MGRWFRAVMCGAGKGRKAAGQIICYLAERKGLEPNQRYLLIFIEITEKKCLF